MWESSIGRLGLAGLFGGIDHAEAVEADVRFIATIRRRGAFLLQTGTHSLGRFVGTDELGHSAGVWRTETIATLITRFATVAVGAAGFEDPEAA